MRTSTENVRPCNRRLGQLVATTATPIDMRSDEPFVLVEIASLVNAAAGGAGRRLLKPVLAYQGHESHRHQLLFADIAACQPELGCVFPAAAPHAPAAAPL